VLGDVSRVKRPPTVTHFPALPLNRSHGIAQVIRADAEVEVHPNVQVGRSPQPQREAIYKEAWDDIHGWEGIAHSLGHRRDDVEGHPGCSTTPTWNRASTAGRPTT
jgi:hypothetical protein